MAQVVACRCRPPSGSDRAERRPRCADAPCDSHAQRSARCTRPAGPPPSPRTRPRARPPPTPQPGRSCRWLSSIGLVGVEGFEAWFLAPRAAARLYPRCSDNSCCAHIIQYQRRCHASECCPAANPKDRKNLWSTPTAARTEPRCGANGSSNISINNQWVEDITAPILLSLLSVALGMADVGM